MITCFGYLEARNGACRPLTENLLGTELLPFQLQSVIFQLPGVKRHLLSTRMATAINRLPTQALIL